VIDVRRAEELVCSIDISGVPNFIDDPLDQTCVACRLRLHLVSNVRVWNGPWLRATRITSASTGRSITDMTRAGVRSCRASAPSWLSFGRSERRSCSPLTYLPEADGD